MDMEEVYQEGQRNCGLEVGDSVRVLRHPKTHEYGWCDVVPPKNYAGAVGVITDITAVGVHVDFKNGDDYNYPYFVLEKVPNFKHGYEFKPFDKVLVRDENSKAWEPGFYARYCPVLPYPHITLRGVAYKQCIPYEKNEHLAFTNEFPED